jgi:hypothetical protein
MSVCKRSWGVLEEWGLQVPREVNEFWKCRRLDLEEMGRNNNEHNIIRRNLEASQGCDGGLCGKESGVGPPSHTMEGRQE